MIRLILLASTITAIFAEDLTVQKRWNNFKLNYEKTYNSPLEERTRYRIFHENLKKIDANNQKHQTGETSWYMGINQFTDITFEEFKEKLTLNKPQMSGKRNTTFFEPPLGVRIPQELNWVNKGAVTPVKDQGDCGSCWSFSATGALEAQYFFKHKTLVSLSEQNLIDCSSNYGNSGCGGGLMVPAFEYVRDHGIMPEDSYPYNNSTGNSCYYESSKSLLTVSSIGNLRVGSEAHLQMAVATIGPISIGINADPFYSYGGGILDVDDCSNERYSLDHAVLVVGYGHDYKNVSYWLIKNSWGRKWGENGYIRIARNKDNMCGLATDASYSLIN